MMKIFVVTVLVSVLAFVNGQVSPCPDEFEYIASGPGHWEGVLNIELEYTLHGTWIRLRFDKPVKNVQVQDNVLEVVPKSENEIQLKNRNLVLDQGELVKFQFKVSYDGTDVPALVGYRLNGRDICPTSDEYN